VLLKKKMPEWNTSTPTAIQKIGVTPIEKFITGWMFNKATRLQIINNVPDKLKFNPGCSVMGTA
jgi:hypothetical protein